MSNGKDKPGEFRTITFEGMTQQEFEAAMKKAIDDGFTLRVAVFYKDKH